MCNRYAAPTASAIEHQWKTAPTQANGWGAEIFPRAVGPFIRLNKALPDNRPELVSGRWGLIPHFAKTAQLRWQTNNARSEELSHKPTYRDSWARGQRCIIPAISFDEPNWETGVNQWWRFTRADGALWGLAGLWNRWTDPGSGEIVESYTMLTINADAHPLMRRMHKPDPKLPADAQDKRSVIVIEDADAQQWLAGTLEQAQSLMRLAPVEVFHAQPLGQVMEQSLLL